MIPYGMSHFNAHHLSNSFFFAWLLGNIQIKGDSSSFSFHFGTIIKFEDMVASSAVFGFQPMLSKNLKIAKTTNLGLAFEGGLMFLSWKLR